MSALVSDAGSATLRTLSTGGCEEKFNDLQFGVRWLVCFECMDW